MSPELETLDQLLGGDLSLAIIRTLYPDDDRFRQGLTGLLHSGDVRLLALGGDEIPSWRWPEFFADPAASIDLDHFKLRITKQGASKIT